MTDVNIAKLGGWRVFIQDGGSSPDNPYNYYGHISLTGLPQELGASTLVQIPSSAVRNKWDNIDLIPASEGLVTTEFTQRMDKFLRDFWWQQSRNNCLLNLAVVYDDCGRPDDVNSFAGKIILRKARLTNFDPFGGGAINPQSGDENAVVDMTGSLEILNRDEFRPLAFEEVADAALLAQVLDIVVADKPQCGDCGTPSDGCQTMYALQVANSGSPGLSSQIIRTRDGFNTSAAVDIPTLGGSSGSALAAIGRYLVVVSNASESHHWALISDINAGTPNWSEVSGGYVGSSGPNAIYSKSPARSFIAGDGGYIYLLTNPTSAVQVLSDGSATSQNLNAIDGFGATVVAVGASNAVIASHNDGRTFATITGPSPGNALTAIEVIDERLWWVGTDNGEVWYTVDGGDTWTQKTLAADLGHIDRIVFVNEIVGYISARPNTGDARIYRTADNGYSWHNSEPYLDNLPAATSYNALAVCGYNTVVAGGVQAGNDGILAVAS